VKTGKEGEGGGEGVFNSLEKEKGKKEQKGTRPCPRRERKERNREENPLGLSSPLLKEGKRERGRSLNLLSLLMFRKKKGFQW